MTDRPELRVRLATGSDATTIAEIYNQGIEERIATFETAPRSAQDVETQLAEKGDRFPTVVVERDGADRRLGRRRPLPGEAGLRGRGRAFRVRGPPRSRNRGRAGGTRRLAREYEARGFWKLVSRIFPENTPSLALHERAGFRDHGEGPWPRTLKRRCGRVQLPGEPRKRAHGERPLHLRRRA